jgi:hypothetical protein
MKYCVFSGNYPQYIREALVNRSLGNFDWREVNPSQEAIRTCDFIWKPFNFQKMGFEMIDRRMEE